MHPHMNLKSKILFYITQVDEFRKLIGRFGRDMINDANHNVRRILNGRDTNLRTEHRLGYLDDV